MWGCDGIHAIGGEWTPAVSRVCGLWSRKFEIRMNHNQLLENEIYSEMRCGDWPKDVLVEELQDSLVYSGSEANGRAERRNAD